MLRKACIEDLEELCKIEQVCFEARQRYSKEVIKEFLAGEGIIFLVEESNSELIGSIIVSVSNKVARIISIAVMPEFRMKGVGSKLLREAEEKAKELKVNKFVLEVGVNNASAVNFYLSHNYKIDFIIPNYYLDQDAYRMSKLSNRSTS
jgi:ribosomal-protein-alanine N-acetyltransferase